ncbi:MULTISPECIES: four-helix bundle copper-binding protein [unclassified Paenibacillus]|uniref:Four-helix bundle copper-binding protein n=1 Tax=Paenibacillus provencensis TaxID=441151 RepID=A0ABW3PQS6_9BACL|nr:MULTISPECIES: four-helix bundle copper-binding protein [unclassified Paenibacillus]MCM3128177.1 four-helix bundle copper-binding protein [Paenibacillus sp. MER 78]SFS83205.1 protein of unknown function [Paenibacillus sp. 453mf]
MLQEKYQAAVNALHECMAACNHCYDACLQEDHVGMMVECIRLDRECADICGYLEQALLRGTPVVSELAKACAAICEACGTECQQHDMEHCRKCAEACFQCAEVCRGLAA